VENQSLIMITMCEDLDECDVMIGFQGWCVQTKD